MVSPGKNAKARLRTPESLAKSRFWEPNRIRARMLTVDMDFPDSEARLAAACAAQRIPAPDVYVLNSIKGTLQASWWIDPIPARLLENRSSGVGWLYARVLESLRMRLDGDPCFADTRRRNPYCTDGQTVMVSSQACIHSLASIRSWLGERGLFTGGGMSASRRRLVETAWRRSGGKEGITAARSAVKGARNTTVFAAAISALRNGHDPVAAAASVKCTPPLPAKEIDTIIASARRCASRPAPAPGMKYRQPGLPGPSTGMHDLCSQWGRKGGRADTPRQRRTRMRNLAAGSRMNSVRHMMTRDQCLAWLRRYGGAALRLLRTTGSISGASASAVARTVGASRQTVSRCLHEIMRMLKEGGIADKGRNPLAGQGLVPGLAWTVARFENRVTGFMAGRGLTMIRAGAPPDPADPVSTPMSWASTAAPGRGGALA